MSATDGTPPVVSTVTASSKVSATSTVSPSPHEPLPNSGRIVTPVTDGAVVARALVLTMTVSVSVAVLLPPLPVTVSSKKTLPEGMVKLGVAVSAPVSGTVGVVRGAPDAS